jgi:hypothetical protein
MADMFDSGTNDNNQKMLGIKLLIAFYSFIFLQNLMSWRQFGGTWANTVVLSIILGTLVYLIVGFIRRTSVSRIVAIIFHVMYQIVLTISFALIHNEKFIKHYVNNISDVNLQTIKTVVIVTFVLFTCVNICAVYYLMKHKSYFSLGNEAAEDSID